MEQLSFLASEELHSHQKWGTFKDSLQAPIHNWFTYPAGFSYKAVVSSLQANGIKFGKTIYDPFMGSGTTNLVAKELAINSYGVEAHPFIFRIAHPKMNWEIDGSEIARALRQVNLQVKEQQSYFNDADLPQLLKNEFPELVLKCYDTNTLLDLLFIRNAVIQSNFSPTVTDIFFVGLTSVLRQVAKVATGWPYIAPNKSKTTSRHKNAWNEFTHQINKMVNDINSTIADANPNYRNASHCLFNADSRHTQELIPPSSIDHVFTSPPYLNNFDYADRTRLELYFWGEAKNWGEISATIRTKLITSATTQISRGDPRYHLAKELQQVCPTVAEFLNHSISQLREIRLTRGGKKSYDHLVSGYFNDIFLILSELYRVLKIGSKAVLVLGDSAPYGVHIPTDELIGKMALGLGFTDYRLQVLRERGGKWKDNP